MDVKSAPKTVSVTFAGDDDVIHHITPLSERRSSKILDHSANLAGVAMVL